MIKVRLKFSTDPANDVFVLAFSYENLDRMMNGVPILCRLDDLGETGQIAVYYVGREESESSIGRDYNQPAFSAILRLNRATVVNFYKGGVLDIALERIDMHGALIVCAGRNEQVIIQNLQDAGLRLPALPEGQEYQFGSVYCDAPSSG